MVLDRALDGGAAAPRTGNPGGHPPNAKNRRRLTRLFNTDPASAIYWQRDPPLSARQAKMAEGLLGRLSGRGASSKAGAGKNFEVALSDEEWRGQLTPEQYRVLRQHGTERAGTSPLDKQYSAGIYHCAGCGQPLFDAGAKFNSRTGWPRFSAPL